MRKSPACRSRDQRRSAGHTSREHGGVAQEERKRLYIVVFNRRLTRRRQITFEWPRQTPMPPLTSSLLDTEKTKKLASCYENYPVAKCSIGEACVVRALDRALRPEAVEAICDAGCSSTSMGFGYHCSTMTATTTKAASLYYFSLQHEMLRLQQGIDPASIQRTGSDHQVRLRVGNSFTATVLSRVMVVVATKAVEGT